MTISLLYIVVPTILVLAVLILYMNSRNKAVMKEIGNLKSQLEKMDNVPVSSAAAVLPAESSEEIQDCSGQTEKESGMQETGIKEKDDAQNEKTTEKASAYNTGKSGKIYTKEELELLIKE